ncbi:MAG: aminoglycoside phosphotransferase family protein [Promethearchaeota archaeon]
MKENVKMENLDLKKKNYKIGEISLDFNQFVKIIYDAFEFKFKEREYRKKIGKIIYIEGPFDGKINSIYHFKTDQNFDFIFRARISKAFRYENIVKEKILFPFLDGVLDINTPNLGKKIQDIANRKIGFYEFKSDAYRLPVKIPNLYFYDESCKKIPYIFSISEYIQGTSFFYPLQNVKANNPSLLNSKKYKEIFYKIGQILGKLHNIEFDGFYEDIRHIGQPKHQLKWPELFQKQLKKELNEAKRHKAIQPLLPKIKKYFEVSIPLIEDEVIPVLFHNDYQSQNIIVEESNTKFTIKGLIDFDNWRIGPPAQDLVKMQYWTIENYDFLNDEFLKGYLSIQPKYTRENLQTRINIYKMLWFILVYNFEMDKILKNEQNADVDARFPSAMKYLDEIKKILDL